MVAAPNRIRVNCDLRHVTVVLCCDPKAFTHTNPLDGMSEGGCLVWESEEEGEQGNALSLTGLLSGANVRPLVTPEVHDDLGAFAERAIRAPAVGRVRSCVPGGLKQSRREERPCHERA